MSRLRRSNRAVVGDPSIIRGLPFTRLGNVPLFFETEFFKYAAAPQYLIRYHLVNNSPVWTCTCPDFRYRRAATATMCKHCQGSSLLVRAPTPFVTAHISPISLQSYDLLRPTPIGAALSVFGPGGKIRVDVTGDSGYIAFTRGQWKCYTCGGRDGRTYLKGRQCKHIACYSESLVDDNYEQYCTVLTNQAFSRDMRQQRRQGRTAWQRFN